MKRYILNLLKSNTIKGNLLICAYEIIYINLSYSEKIVELTNLVMCDFYNHKFKNEKRIYPYDVKRNIHILNKENVLNIHPHSSFDDIIISINDEYIDYYKTFIHLSFVA